jgi:hypothetical protein
MFPALTPAVRRCVAAVLFVLALAALPRLIPMQHANADELICQNETDSAVASIQMALSGSELPQAALDAEAADEAATDQAAAAFNTAAASTSCSTNSSSSAEAVASAFSSFEAAAATEQAQQLALMGESDGLGPVLDAVGGLSTCVVSSSTTSSAASLGGQSSSMWWQASSAASIGGQSSSMWWEASSASSTGFSVSSVPSMESSSSASSCSQVDPCADKTAAAAAAYNEAIAKRDLSRDAHTAWQNKIIEMNAYEKELIAYSTSPIFDPIVLGITPAEKNARLYLMMQNLSVMANQVISLRQAYYMARNVWQLYADASQCSTAAEFICKNLPVANEVKQKCGLQ